MNPRVTVAICTRNRCDALRLTLDSFVAMEVPAAIDWEMVIVNNNSTDDTDEVIGEFSNRLPVRRLYREEPGLGGARNTALEEARGEIVAFTDDDCLVDRRWLTTLVREFDADPQLAGLGGRVELYDERDLPVTIRTSRERVAFASLTQLFDTIPGCNMAFTRKAIEQVGLYDGRFGAGTRVHSGEDSDYLYRVLSEGLRLVYCPDVLVYHNHGRRTEAQVERLNSGYMVGRGAFYCKHILRGRKDIAREAYWEIRAWLTHAMGRRLHGIPPASARLALCNLLRGALLFLTPSIPRR